MTKFLTVACTIILFGSCKNETIRGSGAINTETRVLPAFTQIDLGGSEEAVISYGSASQVTITGYQNLLPVYETTVVGNTLYLKYKSDLYNVKNSNIKLHITLPALAGMRINGSGKMEATGFVNTGLSVSVNGSGYIFIGGSQYINASYSINGSGEVEAATTAVEAVNAHIAGSGEIDLKVSKKLKATISGSGNIYYRGGPATVETSVSGSGKITKRS